MESKEHFCDKCGGKFDCFNRKLPVLQPDGFPIATLATDAIVVRPNKTDPKQTDILLIKRGKVEDPYKGMIALPGGRVEYGEDPILCILRELKEECSIEIKSGAKPKLFGVYGDPKRDARGHVVSIVYIVEVDEKAVPKAGDDAVEANFHVLSEVLKNPAQFAFDHAKILQDFIAKKAH